MDTVKNYEYTFNGIKQKLRLIAVCNRRQNSAVGVVTRLGAEGPWVLLSVCGALARLALRPTDSLTSCRSN
jgi:hypothetical protein